MNFWNWLDETLIWLGKAWDWLNTPLLHFDTIGTGNQGAWQLAINALPFFQLTPLAILSMAGVSTILILHLIKLVNPLS